MTVRKFAPLLLVFIAAVISLLIHKAIFYFTRISSGEKPFVYSLEAIYGFFFLCSAVILLILIRIREKNIDNVGYTFLLLTFAKMGAAYVMLLPIFNSASASAQTEKLNFFIVFAIFLALETVATIRLLNRE